MMFPHTITIYRIENLDENQTITKQIVTGVYYFSDNGVQMSGKGQVENNGITVVASVPKTREFGTTWSCKARDRIIKGTGDDITSLSQLPSVGVYTVYDVAENVADCSVDNVVIRAR